MRSTLATCASYSSFFNSGLAGPVLWSAVFSRRASRCDSDHTLEAALKGIVRTKDKRVEVGNPDLLARLLPLQQGHRETPGCPQISPTEDHPSIATARSVPEFCGHNLIIVANGAFDCTMLGQCGSGAIPKTLWFWKVRRSVVIQRRSNRRQHPRQWRTK
jgi:hypothetical protein